MSQTRHSIKPALSYAFMSDSAVPVIQPNGEVASATTPIADRPPDPSPPQVEPEPRPLTPRDPMLEFAYACLRREFVALTALRPTHEELPPPEDIHRMRIATRRLRVALRLFRRLLPSDAAALRKEFSWFARTLGDVRDLDVYAENFRSYLQAIPVEQHAELGGYELHLRRARADARNNLGALFGGERYAALLDAFATFLADAPTPGARRRWRSFRVRDGIDKYLRKSTKRVRRLGANITPKSRAKKLHKLRIRAKRLRYELEFFLEVYPSLERAVKATKTLQDMLGTHQDACTATQRLRDYARSIAKGSSKAPAALQQLLESQERNAQETRRAFAAEWQRFETTIAHSKLVA